jgi:hypothetical protein
MNNKQRKIISASNNFGNTNIKKQQGSTIEIFHYIPFIGFPIEHLYQFFKEVKNTQFPFTNIEDNQLQVGESMIIKNIHFDALLISKWGGFGPIGSVYGNFPIGGGAVFPNLDGVAMSQWSWYNENNRVIKDKSIVSHSPLFNGQSKHENDWNKELETDITIQPLIRFQCDLRTPNWSVVIPRDIDVYLGCHVEGTGTLFAPKNTF